MKEYIQVNNFQKYSFFVYNSIKDFEQKFYMTLLSCQIIFQIFWWMMKKGDFLEIIHEILLNK